MSQVHKISKINSIQTETAYINEQHWTSAYTNLVGWGLMVLLHSNGNTVP